MIFKFMQYFNDKTEEKVNIVYTFKHLLDNELLVNYLQV